MGPSAIRGKVQQRHQAVAVQLAQGCRDEHWPAVLEWTQARA